MVEQWTFNPLVLGSSPRGGTIRSRSGRNGDGLLESANRTVAAVSNRPWGDALLASDGTRRPCAHQRSNQIEIVGVDASETRHADNVSQLDECG